MSVSAVTNAFANYAQKTTGGSPSAGGTAGAAASALQEATETKAQTQKEAQKGDRVAIKKLQAQKQKQDDANGTEPGKGDKVDHKA